MQSYYNITTIEIRFWKKQLSGINIFLGLSRLLVLPFENNDDRTADTRYFFPKVEIKDYNVMMDGQKFRDQPLKMI